MIDTATIERENQELRRQLAEAEDALRAIRQGQVDAIVVENQEGTQIFSLEGAETIYRLAFETMAEAAISLTGDGRIVFCNKRFGEFVARPLEQVVGRNFAEFVAPADQSRVARLLGECARGAVTDRVVLQAPDGSVRPVHIGGRPLPPGSNGPTLCLVAADLTELEDSTHRIDLLLEHQRQMREVQAALCESEGRFRAMADGTPLPIWVTDPEGRGLFVNRAYRDYFGLKSDAAQGSRWEEALHPEDCEAFISEYYSALRARRPFSAQVRVRRYDGQWRWIESHAQPRFAVTGEFLGMAGSSPDITEQKQFQLELSRLVEERTARLQELVNELEHFSYTITHDMRAPLRAMRGFAEVLRELCRERLDDQENMMLGRIMTAAERMDALITDALSYSKAVRHELALGPIDLGTLLRGMLDTYPEFQAASADIQVAPDLPRVMGNEAGLTQCFSNLLGNAVKFVEPGQIARVRVWSELRDGWVRVWVEDEGIGITPVMLPRVFEMFSRGASPGAGTGIGLALVRKVVDRMGGRVGVESEAGKGSRFWIELRPVDAGYTNPR